MLRPRTLVCALALSAGAFATVRPLLVQEMPQPTEHHARIMEGVGEWQGKITFYDMPGMPAEMSAEATDSVTALGGFWTTGHFKCDFMGMPFEGIGTMGYDPAKGKYVGTWIDSFTPSLINMEGDFDEKAGGIEMRWMAPHMTGEIMPHRSVTIHRGDTYVSHFYLGEGDAEVKNMTIAMKRKAQPVEASDADHGKDHDGGDQHDR